MELKPETDEEAFLLAAFLRYDANVLSVSVERFQNGHIASVTLLAEESRA